MRALTAACWERGCFVFQNDLAASLLYVCVVEKLAECLCQQGVTGLRSHNTLTCHHLLAGCPELAWSVRRPAEFAAGEVAVCERAGTGDPCGPAASAAQPANTGQERVASSAGAAALGACGSSGSDSDDLPPIHANVNRQTLEWAVSESGSDGEEQDQQPHSSDVNGVG